MSVASSIWLCLDPRFPKTDCLQGVINRLTRSTSSEKAAPGEPCLDIPIGSLAVYRRTEVHTFQSFSDLRSRKYVPLQTARQRNAARHKAESVVCKG